MARDFTTTTMTKPIEIPDCLNLPNALHLEENIGGKFQVLLVIMKTPISGIGGREKNKTSA